MEAPLFTSGLNQLKIYLRLVKNVDMIYGIGTDIIEIFRVEKAISRYGQKFLDRIFTENEQAYCLKHKMSARHFSGRFAAKEAIVKALGTGIGKEVNWTDIEILNDANGKPHAALSPSIQAKFPSLNLEISMSHCKEYAVAFAYAFLTAP